MISRKMEELLKNNSVVRAMFEEGKRMQREFGPENVYDFSLGNPSICPPEQVRDAVYEILRDEDPLAVHGYMNNSGYEDVRSAVAASLNERFSVNFGQENIVMTSGAAGGLNVILKTLLNPGDEVIVFAPFFGEYANYVNNYDGILSVISPHIPDFQPNLREFAEKISDKTRAVIINNPNNPTGVVYTENTMKAMAEVLYMAQNRFGNPIYLISDEPYRELVYDGATVPFLTKYYENTVICYSFSKSLSLPGERIGYLVLPDALEGAPDIMDAVNVANRVLGFVNAPSLMQRVIARNLDTKTDVEAYNRNREFLYEALISYGYEMIKPQGAFYMFLRSMEEDDVAFSEKAKELHLLLVPGSSYGCPGYVRLSYCVDMDMIKRSLPSFQRLAESYRQ